MEIQERNDGKGDGLNESWVQLHFQGQLPVEVRDTSSPPTLSRPVQMNTQMEKLLLEAQRDSLSRSSRASSNVSIASSINASVASSRASPKSPHTPNNEPNMDPVLPPFTTQFRTPFTDIPAASKGTDWIWDWSSRPEALPPSDWGSRFKHPKRHKLSIRNTRVMSSGPFHMENLPTLLFTHACTFIMGAAVMFIYLKKYCQMSAITID